jgi:heptosyltransferase II
VSERILVRAPNWIGDVVLSLGAVRDVRRNFSRARLEILARPWVADVYRAVAEVDAVRESHGAGADAAALRGAFDTAVLLTNSFGTAFTMWRAGIPERWGYATDGRGLLLTRRARASASTRRRSQVYYYRAMLAGVGLRVSAAPDVSLACPEAWADRGRRLLGEGGFVGLVPGAAYGSAKAWPAERFAAAGDAVAKESGVGAAILGGPAERAVAEEIASCMAVRPRILCGETSLADLIGVVASLRLLISNDSGPMHLASALGTPTLAVFGSTDWRETAPAGPGPSRLVREDVACAPCMLRECPIDHRCMTRVSAERVVAESLSLLEAKAAPPA